MLDNQTNFGPLSIHVNIKRLKNDQKEIFLVKCKLDINKLSACHSGTLNFFLRYHLSFNKEYLNMFAHAYNSKHRYILECNLIKKKQIFHKAQIIFGRLTVDKFFTNYRKNITIKK